MKYFAQFIIIGFFIAAIIGSYVFGTINGYNYVIRNQKPYAIDYDLLHIEIDGNVYDYYLK